MKIIENVQFCALTNIAFQGQEAEDSNFQKLAKLRGKDDSDVEQWIKKGRGSYLHHDIQNELLKIMSLKVLRKNVLMPIQQGSFIKMPNAEFQIFFSSTGLFSSQIILTSQSLLSISRKKFFFYSTIFFFHYEKVKYLFSSFEKNK